MPADAIVEPIGEIKINIPGVTSLDAPPPQPAPDPKPAAPVVNNPLADKPVTGEAQEPTAKPQIDTDITGEKPTKSPAQFAEERRKAKEEKLKKDLGVPELQQTVESTKAELLKLEMELRDTRLEKERLAKEREEFEAVAATRKAEIDKSQEVYFDTYKAAVNPHEDQEFVETSSRFVGALTANLPDRIPVGDDERRVFPEQLLSDPGMVRRMENVMSHYALARGSGDSASMDMAVNAVAQLMGVPMVFDPDPAKCQGLLASSDPVFQQIESAMKSAVPHYGAKRQRENLLKEQAPALARQQLLERERAIAGNINKAVFLQPDEAADRLRADPTDSAAVLSTLIQDSPELKEVIERTVARFAPAFARMGQINMPTLPDGTPDSIRAHQQELLGYRQRLASAMPAAVLGTVAGPVIASLIGQVKAMSARLGGVAQNTNPGPIESGGSGPAPTRKIDTQI